MEKKRGGARGEIAMLKAGLTWAYLSAEHARPAVFYYLL